MKWINKGHEYDDLYTKIKSLSGIYLFGAGHDGEVAFYTLSEQYTGNNILGFVDNDISKLGQMCCGRYVYSLDSINLKENEGIVISISSEYMQDIDRQLNQKGFEKNVNYWHYEEFISVYAAYKYQKVFFSSICILPTTACNLKCKDCLNFTNYIERFEMRPIDRMKAEVDLYFKCVDYTGLFFISGGEPFTYHELPDLIRYIAQKYRSRMFEFGLVTNGTIAPSEELLSVLSEVNIKLTIDDYRDSVPDKRGVIEDNLEIFKQHSLMSKITIRKYDEWISLYPHNVVECSDKELEIKYDLCHCPWQEYRGGKIYSCNYASFAEVAGICESDDSNETFDLRTYQRENLNELVEFRLGYTRKGYVEFCKKCAGYMEINPYKVKAAEQG